MRSLFGESDITANRHGGNAQSEAAFQRVQHALPRQRAEVLAFIRERGLDGATVKEVALHFGKPPNAVSGRLTELKRDGLIHDTGRRRKGAAVLEATT